MNNIVNKDYVFGRAYAWYALTLLMLVAAFNLIDRMIVTILAGEIKTALDLSDAELGLLYGTFFAIFYSLFGIPLGRLGDTWKRTKLIPIGLASWSFFTMLSGLSTNLWQFAATRIGVGVGEASSGPSATSLLSDYFPKRLRGTAIGLYACGIPIGVGVSLFLGGAIVDTWNAWYPDGDFPLGLAGWQVAFIAVALPGFVLALLVARLREPPRGVSEGMPEVHEPHPFRKCWQDFMAVIPPLTFFNFARLKVPRRVWLINVAVAAGLLLAVLALNAWTNALASLDPSKIYAQWGWLQITGNTAQWGALGFGLYCLFSWSQSLGYRDQPAFDLVLGTPTMLLLMGAGAVFMTLTNGLMAWAPRYAVLTYNESLSTVGLRFGFFAAVAGLVGTALGGWLSDWLRRATPRGRLYLSALAMTLPWPLVWLTLAQPSLTRFLAAFCVLSVVTTAWLPGMISAIQDLVLPRMRGLTYAVYVLVYTIIGLGTGPYLAGLISDVTGDLGKGIMSLYHATPLIALLMWLAIRGVDAAERTRLQRARAAGEEIAADTAI